MFYRVRDVFASDFRLIVQVEHLHADHTFWHVEHYVFLGREGLKHKRVLNEGGEAIMDNDQVAPMSNAEYYLPEGRDWKRRSEIILDDASIHNVIQETHRARVASGWPQGAVDVLGHGAGGTQVDREGCGILVAQFQSLVDKEFN